MIKKPLILVTNDDGISAPGLRTLIEIMNKIGDVVVVAPNTPHVSPCSRGNRVEITAQGWRHNHV